MTGKPLDFPGKGDPPMSVVQQELERLKEAYGLQGAMLIFHTGKTAKIVYTDMNVYERLAVLIVAVHEAETERQMGTGEA